MTEHDLIIVGAGPAGAHLASQAAKLGLKTLLLERLSRDRVGDKVCGEGIALHHLKNAGIPYPKGKELGTSINGIDIYPPSMQNYVTVSQLVEGEPCQGWTVDRLYFGQRLLGYAEKSGAEIRDHAHVLEPLLDNGTVVGVKYKDTTSNAMKEVRAKVTVDASGMSASLRRRIQHPLIERTIALNDQAVCYREVLELQAPFEPADRCWIIMDDRYSPGGYVWIFPRGGKIANVGLGTQGGHGYKPKELYQQFLASNPIFKDAKVIHGGGGAAPIRRPLWSYVADGIIFTGDSGCHVNPIHGGGIGSAIEAGHVATPFIKEAIEADDVSAEGLWGFNVKYNRHHYGQKIASLDLMRRLLQEVGNEEFEFVINNRIITTEDLLRANAGEGIQLSATDKASRFLRGLRRFGLLRRIQKVSKAMREMLNLYRSFPETPTPFPEWKKEVEQLYRNLGYEP
ncbi:MAG: geranylgeranyl reductase family protein [Candidatus Hermodarchaeia archaeon]|jgi:geranylgeranyl reductase family protein